jgi:hypothetical protein
VTEGGDGKEVDLTCLVPPGFFLSNLTLWSTAHIVVNARLNFTDEPTCSGVPVTQGKKNKTKNNKIT